MTTVKVGDRISWDKEAHTHTRQMNIASTGRIEKILPKGFTHVDNTVERCDLRDAVMFTVKVDDGPARIGLSADYEDLVFPDAGEDDGMDLLADLWDEETTAMVDDLMG
jgi:hypothetical protein